MNKLKKNTKPPKGITYLIPGQNIVNSDVWVMDETYLSEKTVILIVVGLKTTAILGTCIASQKQGKAFIYASEIEELYRHIIESGNNVPILLHTDQKPEYAKKNILDFFQEWNIKHSVAGKNENQVIESINNQIKTNIVQIIHKKYSGRADYKAFEITQKQNFNELTIGQKATSKKYREYLFHSNFFQQNVEINQVVEEAVQIFNEKKSQNSGTNFNRGTLNKLNNYINPPKELRQGTKKCDMGQIIQKVNDSAFIEAALQIKKIIQTKDSEETKLELIQNIAVSDDSYMHKAQQDVMKALVFIASQNQHQMEQNTYQIRQIDNQTTKIDHLIEENSSLVKKVQTLTDENEEQKERQRAKELTKEKKRNRQRRPQTQPFTRKMVQELLHEIRGKTYQKARNRCAFTILTITGIRYQELLGLRVEQILSLITNGYCPITRKKRGPANLKAFLRQPGVELLKERKDDFEFIISRIIERSPATLTKEETETWMKQCFVFSPEKKPEKTLSRSFFNDKLNKELLEFSKKRNLENVYTTHSFRHDFITELWKDSNDIEFVRQFMGHKQIQSSVAYIQDMAEAEKIKKILEIDLAKQKKYAPTKNN